MIRVRRALLSVHDKSGLEALGRALVDAGAEILSTGGTSSVLRAAGVPVTEVSSVTGFPEVFGGRVKTLHPKIHGGILLRRNVKDDIEVAAEQQIGAIDLVAGGLYPFEETAMLPGATLADIIEQIDIGGPAMIRAAAKNHEHVVVLTDPVDYATVIAQLRDQGGVATRTARDLAVRAFARTAAYDAAIASWMASADGVAAPEVVLRGRRQRGLRYGENPHQAATAFVVSGERGGVLQARVLQGKELSYNNIVDLDAAWCLARDLDGPGAVVIKHANPCGVAENPSLVDALRLARASDPVSAFGGVYAFNATVDEPLARALVDGFFVECVIARHVDEAALGVLSQKKALRVLAGELPPARRDGQEWKRLTGGFLLQDWDDASVDPAATKIATQRAPTEEELRGLRFAWRVVKHVKSNAIVFCGPDRTLGIGAGQSSRVDAVELAVLKARKHGLSLRGSVVASDAFFPFRDGLDAAAEAGATAVIQPGGSVRDDEVIAAANERGMAMVLTGRRHFRH
jgi:phosphoribosylaminoimidazolecarboxamide formyltransferase/IMP cyclohydrolase